MNMSLDLESRCKHENKKKKSKYLIYNENTKLLEVKADTKSKFQTFLERKKIYFETVMMLALSIAGVIVLSFKLDAPSPCRLDAPDLDLICYASADCLHQHLQVI